MYVDMKVERRVEENIHYDPLFALVGMKKKILVEKKY